MTKLQLEYWQLRWKQHYENVMLQLKSRELALEFEKLAETQRHNRVAERQEKQRIILETQQLTHKWAELNEKVRAAMVSEALKYNEVKIREAEAISNIALNSAKLEQTLQSTQLAAQEFRMSVIEKKNTINQDWLKAEAQAFKSGFMKGGAANLSAEIKNISSSKEFEDFENSLGKLGGWFTETYGPESIKKYHESREKYVPRDSERQSDVHQVLSERVQDENKYRQSIGESELPDPTRPKSKVYYSGGSKVQQPSHSPATSINVTEARTQGGSRVIYSPGARVSSFGPTIH